MPLDEDLNRALRLVDDLARSLDRLGNRSEDSLDLRRARTDAAHLKESLNLLRQALAPSPTARPKDRPDMVSISDAPYDRSLWAGAEDEGLGSPHRHAP